MNLEEEEKGLKDIKHLSCMILYRLDKIHPDSIFILKFHQIKWNQWK